MTDPSRPSRHRRELPAAARARRATVDDPAVVLEAALRFLEPRARSVAEVRRRLTGNGYRPELVEAAIERLLDLGMLDDEAFARHWVESRDRAHPRGAMALRGELRRMGISDDVARAALTARDGDGSLADDARAGSADERAAERLLERKRGSLARYPDPHERRRRAYALLARSGFDPDVCRRVAASALPDPSDVIQDPSDALPDDP